MRTNEIKKAVENMKVAEMRKVAGKYGIKNASQYKRVELEQLLIDAMVAEAKKSKAVARRVKADKVENENVEVLAKEMLEGIETLSSDDLMKVNRKVLITVMKMLHCSKWYRTYDKATMVEKIVNKIAA